MSKTTIISSIVGGLVLAGAAGYIGLHYYKISAVNQQLAKLQSKAEDNGVTIAYGQVNVPWIPGQGITVTQPRFEIRPIQTVVTADNLELALGSNDRFTIQANNIRRFSPNKSGKQGDHQPFNMLLDISFPEDAMTLHQFRLTSPEYGQAQLSATLPEAYTGKRWGQSTLAGAEMVIDYQSGLLKAVIDNQMGGRSPSKNGMTRDKLASVMKTLMKNAHQRYGDQPKQWPMWFRILRSFRTVAFNDKPDTIVMRYAPESPIIVKNLVKQVTVEGGNIRMPGIAIEVQDNRS